jgi:hypothetical protein
MWLLLLLLAFFQQAENVAGLGNPGKIDLGLDLGRARLLFLRRGSLGRKVLANLFGFIVLYGARVGFLLGDPNFFQDVQNGLAFHLKLSGQIIDSNFHPFSVPSNPLRAHMDLTPRSLLQLCGRFLLLFLLTRLLPAGSFAFWNIVRFA